jgi:hypothetical protein
MTDAGAATRPLVLACILACLRDCQGGNRNETIHCLQAKSVCDGDTPDCLCSPEAQLTPKRCHLLPSCNSFLRSTTLITLFESFPLRAVGWSWMVADVGDSPAPPPCGHPLGIHLA